MAGETNIFFLSLKGKWPEIKKKYLNKSWGFFCFFCLFIIQLKYFFFYISYIKLFDRKLYNCINKFCYFVTIYLVVKF